MANIALTTVDARGMRCPWPALRAAKAMRDAEPFRLIADDPRAESEVRALAAQHGWRINVDESGDATSVSLLLSPAS